MPVRDVAGLCAFDDTPFGVRLTGAQLKDHPEHSMSYSTPPAGPGPHAPVVDGVPVGVAA